MHLCNNAVIASLLMCMIVSVLVAAIIMTLIMHLSLISL